MVRIDPQAVTAYTKSLPPYAGSRGSVVRLRVTDFMTYRSAELRAGAHVNLILGPNGTGKSTIVCAICLGLAGKPKILGRAVQLKEYIRHGANSATIEIELYNPEGLNYVIKRHITTKASVSSRWYLQGKKASISDVEKLTTSLNIQLDNLCQFLPQDRVQEFVVMDSFSLLQNTQKALGNDDLCEKHEKLIKLTAKQKEIEQNLQTHVTSLISVQQVTKRLEKEVETYKGREALKAKIAEWTSKKAWIVYLKSREAFLQLKGDLETLKQQKKQEEAKLAPLKSALESLDTKLAKYRVELNRLRTNNNKMINGVKKKVEEEFDRVEASVGEELAKYNEHERSEQDRLRRVSTLNSKIEGCEKQLEEVRLKGDMDDRRLNAKVAELESQMQHLDDNILEITGEDEKVESDRRYLQARIGALELDLSRMDDLRVSRMQYLKRLQPDVYESVLFFSKPENLREFKGRIHEPMVLHISVNDLRYGRIAERQITFPELNGFFCEDKDDVVTMLKLNEQRKRRISVLHFDGPKSLPFQKPRTKYDPEFMRKWGFEKVLLDLIEGPDYYLSYLSDRFSLENVLIGSEKSERLFQEIMNNTNLTLFYTETSRYQFSSSYYSKTKVSQFSKLPPARVMTTEINAAEKDRLQENLVKWRADEKQLAAQINSRAGKKAELEEERQTVEDQIRDINARIAFRKNLQLRLEQARKQLINLERDKIDLDRLKQTTDKAIMNHRMKLLTVSEFITQEITKAGGNGIMPIIIRRQISLLHSRVISRQTELDQMQGDVKQCEARLRALTPQVEQAAREANANKQDAIAKSKNNETEPPPDVLAGTITEESIETDLSRANVQLTFLMDMDESIVRGHQEKMRELAELQKEKEHGEKLLCDVKEQIATAKAAWLNPLTELIGTVNRNFGRYFSSMGCAGAVGLKVEGDNENDFAKYGIKILVKFRSSEPLSELGGSKGGTLQSGGERVISTALYILALQELTTVPFRVIDEINQGMDATNEARFFNLLCSLAKGPNTPQYFLLTPKMLPPVEYPDNVDFHIIMSGPYVNVPLSGQINAGFSDDEGVEED